MALRVFPENLSSIGPEFDFLKQSLGKKFWLHCILIFSFFIFFRKIDQKAKQKRSNGKYVQIPKYWFLKAKTNHLESAIDFVWERLLGRWLNPEDGRSAFQPHSNQNVWGLPPLRAMARLPCNDTYEAKRSKNIKCAVCSSRRNDEDTHFWKPAKSKREEDAAQAQLVQGFQLDSTWGIMCTHAVHVRWPYLLVEIIYLTLKGPWLGFHLLPLFPAHQSRTQILERPDLPLASSVTKRLTWNSNLCYRKTWNFDRH